VLKEDSDGKDMGLIRLQIALTLCLPSLILKGVHMIGGSNWAGVVFDRVCDTIYR